MRPSGPELPTILFVAPQLNWLPGVLTSCTAGELEATASILKRQAGPQALNTPFTRLRTRTFNSTFCGTGFVTKAL